MSSLIFQDFSLHTRTCTRTGLSLLSQPTPRCSFPGYLRYTGQSELALLNAYNAIDIIVPDDDMSSEVDSIKIMARRGNTGSWQVIKR